MKDMDMVYAIYQYGSFSKAAEELYIGQSSLSMAIQRIENDLGMQLFDRKHHPIRLTEAGEEYIRYYHMVKPAEERMLSRIRDLSGLSTGKFALGGTHYLLSFVLQNSILQFSQQYPNIDLQIVEAQSSQFRNLLLDCKIDVCLQCNVEAPGVQSIGHAFFDDLFFAVPKGYISEYDLPQNYLTDENIHQGGYSTYEHYMQAEYIQRMPFLQLTPGNNLYTRSEAIFQQMECLPTKILHLQQFVTAYVLADTGLGCTLTSSHLIKNLKKDNLVYYTLPSSMMIRDFHFVTRKDAYVTNATRAFYSIFTAQSGKY